MDMNFRRATEILGLPASELAAEFGVQAQTIRQMRLAPSAVNHRSPPPNWEKILIRLARKRGKELSELVEQLAQRAPRRGLDRPS